MIDKVATQHLSRKAIVYVRQSSAYQVVHNTESRKLQYEMKQRLQSLGWLEVEIIDEDLGRSGTSTLERTGFQRMVADVCLGRIGAIAAREVSRFARNNNDWHQLIEMCSLVDTLLIDQETVYDPRRANDRLLLGLKGSMSEYELDLLRQRSLEARWAKARRGELVISAPVGFIKTSSQRLELDPNARVQAAILLIFDKFLELGSARQTLIWFLDAGIELPAVKRVASSVEIRWRQPTRTSICRVLNEPIYAGAYGYGKTKTAARIAVGGTRKSRIRKPLNEWGVLIQNHHEGYISWEKFEKIQTMLKNNAAGFETARHGAARQGAALLAGMLRCRRCGYKLTVNYTGRNHAQARYCCQRGELDRGEACCISFGGAAIDEAVARELLRVVQPCAVEAAALATTDDSNQKQALTNALLLELKSARFEADRAWKQFDAVDPDNRLVADELERRWDSALQRTHDVEARLQREQQATQQKVVADPASLSGLANELSAAWNDPLVDIRLKKRIARALLFEILVDVNSESGETELVLHWRGGLHTILHVRRRRRGENRLHTSVDTVDAIRVLTRVCGDATIASVLNRNDVRTGRGNRWTQTKVTSARTKRGITQHDPERQAAEGWMTLNQAANFLGISPHALRKAVDMHQLPALHPLPCGPWIFRKEDLDAATADGLRRMRSDRPEASDSRQLNLMIPNK